MLAYLDTPSGISGDMFLGCLIDAGWPLAELHAALDALAWPDGADRAALRVEPREVMTGPLRATQLAIHAPEEGQPHRHLSDIAALLDASTLPDAVKSDAFAVFTRLAEAEARVHGTSVEVVHFHEVGALDSILDIVGVCAGVHSIGITALYLSPLPLGEGMAQTQHGQIPLPAPATLELIMAAGGQVRPAPGPGELVTPTGAALALHFAQGRWGMPAMTLRRIGIGAGTKQFAWPNVARLLLGEAALPTGERHSRPSTLIETNIDDMNPEFYTPVAERLLTAGARDVWWTPIQMKKNRPGVKLSVLVPADEEARLAALLMDETTTLGMRVTEVRGYAAERRIEAIETPYGPIPIKLKLLNGEISGAVPEFEPCRVAAVAHGIPTRRVYEAAAALAWERFLGRTDEEATVLGERETS